MLKVESPKESIDTLKGKSTLLYSTKILQSFLHDLHQYTTKGSVVPERNENGIKHIDFSKDKLNTLSFETFLSKFEDKLPTMEEELSYRDLLVENMLPNGEIYSGAVYEGQLLMGFMNGIGTLTSNDGTIYKGDWRMNKKHGFGRQCYRNGDIYEGLWKEGIREGPGKYTWRNGSEYMGYWKGGIVSEWGSLNWPDGNKYNGPWLNGFEDGHGVFTRADGKRYVGTWRRGLKDEYGMYYPPMLPTISSSTSTREDHRILQGDVTSTRCSSSSGGKQKEAMCKHKCRNSFFVNKKTLSEFIADFVNKLNTESSPWSSEEKLRSIFVSNERNAVHSQGHERYNCKFDVDQDTYFCPIVEREHAQGVPMNHNSKVKIPLVSERAQKGCKRCNVKELKSPGETIYKGHRSYNLMLNLQLGIRYSVGKIMQERKWDLCAADFSPQARIRISFPKEGSKVTPTHQSIDFKWKDYCPKAFRHLRDLFKIDTVDYMLSICGDYALRELPSPGKSGSMFYLSHDDRFIIKTLSKTEVKILLGMLPNYYNHVCTNENTLLTKFFGLHHIKASGQKVGFVVMGNIFYTELHIDRRFDLKGSSQGRSAKKVEISKATATLKDLDLDFIFFIDPSWREIILKQIDRDCHFLQSEHIMDYSLLVGIHFRNPKFPAIFSKASCYHMPDSRLDEMARPADHAFSKSTACESLREEKGKKKRLVLVGHESEGHVKGKLQLPGTIHTMQIQLGVNMPAKADCRKQMDGDISQAYDVVLYFGIIDILQVYGLKKKMEHACKSVHFDSLSISAVDPTTYSKRFQDFIRRIFPSQ